MTPESLIADSTIAAVVSDPRQPDNPIVACNNAFMFLTGYDRDEIVGRNCRFLRGERTEPEQTAKLRDAVAERRPTMVELINYRKDGTAFRNAVMIALYTLVDGTGLRVAGNALQYIAALFLMNSWPFALGVYLRRGPRTVWAHARRRWPYAFAGALASAGSYRVKIARHRLDAAVGQLDSLSPLAVLGRGYSLTRLLPSGAIVRSAAQTRPGDAIEILLRQGALDARVERLKERDDRPQV